MEKYEVKWALRDIPDKEKHKFSHTLAVFDSEIQAKVIAEEENNKQRDCYFWYEKQ